MVDDGVIGSVREVQLPVAPVALVYAVVPVLWYQNTPPTVYIYKALIVLGVVWLAQLAPLSTVVYTVDAALAITSAVPLLYVG